MITDTCEVCGSSLYCQKVGNYVQWHHLSISQAIRNTAPHRPEPADIC